MNVTVKYFAYFKEITGLSEEDIQLESGSSLKDLLDIITKKYNFKKEKNMVMSINHDYAKTDVKLKEGDEVAIMLPTSGG
ncbi:MAG: MoaD/ThiS family protein [Candidatus Methanofastidiosa archaeon]|jgi:molybdopterin synthase sulfur carrier subunit|nr:MoaD/ThiS family protein [Candidatus Methanofastidiosa archaeon]